MGKSIISDFCNVTHVPVEVLRHREKENWPCRGATVSRTRLTGPGEPQGCFMGTESCEGQPVCCTQIEFSIIFNNTGLCEDTEYLNEFSIVFNNDQQCWIKLEFGSSSMSCAISLVQACRGRHM